MKINTVGAIKETMDNSNKENCRKNWNEKKKKFKYSLIRFARSTFTHSLQFDQNDDELNQTEFTRLFATLQRIFSRSPLQQLRPYGYSYAVLCLWAN